MRIQWIVPPAAALLVVAVANGLQRGSVREVEERMATLRTTINDWDGRASGASYAGLPGRQGWPVSEKANKPSGWSELVWKLGVGQGEPANMRTLIRLQKELQDYSAADLGAALDEIAGLDGPEQGRRMLQHKLMELLIKKAPEEALRRFADDPGRDRNQTDFQLARALGGWAKTDPAAATAWLDRQIAAGAFDSKLLNGGSGTRLHFEAALLAAVMEGDPDAAKMRVLALPPNERSRFLTRSELRAAADPKAYAELVRGSLEDPSKASATIAAASTSLVLQGGYERVGKFLQEIDSPPGERAAVVENVVTNRVQLLRWSKGVEREDIEIMREWVAKESPGSEDRLTGKALASVARDSRHPRFSEAAEMVSDYHASSGSDDVLIGFLSGWSIPSSEREVALHLAEKISDPGQRESILKRLRK